jgi:Rieske 2Fe-2S family protein
MDTDKNFNNLTSVVQSLPASSYFANETYDSELTSVWYRNWVYAGRADEVSNPGDFKSIRIGLQNILLVRSSDRRINAFFNTCRHRGSILCTEDHGNLSTKHISCPYHRWTYSLDGELVRTPLLDPTPDFDRSNYSLYPVAVEQWGGCIFINLAGKKAPGFNQSMDPSHDHLRNWPLQELTVAHSYQRRIACNWKLFWENFVECYHCPGLHPELCDLVPMYKRSYISHRDEPGWQDHKQDPDPKYRGGLKTGARSWSMDGKIHGAVFPDLTHEDIESAYVYVQNLPSFFIVAHPDYVRIVSILPDGPEHILLKAEWLLSTDSLAKKDLKLAKIVDFGLLVLEQDAHICEVNQQGVRSIAHQSGVLMPQEYEIVNFHRWLLSQG